MNFLNLARRVTALRFVALFVMASILTGCTIPESLLIQPPDSAPISAHLEEALALSPATTELIAFTDWSVIKEIAGVGDLTGEAPLEERLDFLYGQQAQAIGSLFAGGYLRNHAEIWGWDSTDLLWEASLTLDGPPLYLLRFRDDFDFDPVIERLNERGYTTTEVEGATLYSHEMNLTLDWLRTTELSILNIAYVPDEKLFVLASSPEVVTNTIHAVTAGTTLAALPPVRAVAAELGDVGAAMITPLGCQESGAGAFIGQSIEEIKAHFERMRQSEISGLYITFGLGYRVETVDEQSLPLGILVHYYPLAGQAHADLEPRRQLAEEGTSLATATPYAELFDVVDAWVNEDDAGGANLVLALHAIERSPQLFFQMFFQRDLLFSTCGGF